MSIKQVFKNVGAWICHSVDRGLYEYFSWKYMDSQNKIENNSNTLLPTLGEVEISEEQSSLAANHSFERMVFRSKEHNFLRAPQRKNAVIPIIR